MAFEITITDEQLLDNIFALDEVDILEKLGYDPIMCFKTDTDLKETVEENSEVFGIDLKPEYDTINDQDIYDRFVELLSKNKLTYQQWDKFLTKYEL